MPTPNASPANPARTVAILWDHGPVAGRIEIIHGRLQSLTSISAGGVIDGDQFRLPSPSATGLTGAAPRLHLTVADPRLDPGSNCTLLQIHTEKSPVTVFLRDIQAATPVFIPAYGLALTTADDPRSYAQIAADLQTRALPAPHQSWEMAPEATFAAAAQHTRDLHCPTWLAVARDARIFRLHPQETNGYFGSVQPAFHSQRCTLPETNHQPYALDFVLGPGAGCQVQITRRLDDGVLPILQATQTEGEVQYQLTAFATLENQPLAAAAVRGSDWPGTYALTGGCMYSPADRTRLHSVIEAETRGRETELVCCLRVVAVNTGRVPRYAWFKAARITAHPTPVPTHAFDAATGCSGVGPDRIYALHRLNGRPLPQEEIAVLLQPGAAATLDLLLPHQPISRARAAQLAALDYAAHLDACRQFWREKLASAAQIRLPEAAIDERLRAGLLHLDINTLGREPDGPAMACVGAYAPIGSESAPMIQYFDSIGWHHLAARCLQFFIARQREDGFIQNFGGYQLETGPFLWTAGEHYRYTRDDHWVRAVQAPILKASQYLLQWRARNQTEALRGKGYGLLEGKVADPEDFFHSFMLNAVSYLGLARAAEMLATVNPAESRRLAAETAAFREDIRQAYHQALARAPVAPLSDGTWAPTPPSWPEHRGALALYTEPGAWFTHGAFAARDSLIGPLWLVIGEVLDPGEQAATFLLHAHHELMTSHNAGLSQPYYCRHDYIHLRRGEVKPFLQTYYHQLTALQDRETYSFWEHYFFASQHKTHEEAWFLMQTRWMLYLEEGNRLSLLKAIPRAWLADGQQIRLENVVTYFGQLSLMVNSQLRDNRITATLAMPADRRPAEVTLRLPHPAGQRPSTVIGGAYDPATETVTLAPFTGAAHVELRF